MSQIRILQGFKRQPDSQLLAAAGAVLQGMTGNAVFASPPVDLKALDAAIAELNAAIAAQPNGGPAATAHKNNKRAVLSTILSRLAYYVQDNCGEDAAPVLAAGFTVASTNRTRPQLEKPVIAGIDFGKSTQLVIKVHPVAGAKGYEVEMSAIEGSGAPSPWQSAGYFTNSRSITVDGLTPGTTYALRVRAIGGSNVSTDWSDSVAHICA